MTNQTGGGDSEPPTIALRHTFVSMLFALAIAQVAISFSDLLLLYFDDGQAVANQAEQSGSTTIVLWSASTHLIVAFTLICTSWVGWSRSVHRERSKDITDIFSAPFVLLVIELVLVSLYFVLTRSAETNLLEKSGSIRISATPEAYWLMMVYLLYFFWDIINDGLPRHIDAANRPLQDYPIISNIVVFVTGTICRAWVSAACFFSSLFIYHSSQQTNTSLAQVAISDMALLSVVLAFWLLKEVEKPLYKLTFPWESSRQGGRSEPISLFKTIILVATILVYLFCIFFLWITR